MAWTGLGIIVSATPGTRVPILAAGAADIRCDAVMFQALSNASHTNTGRVYIFDRSGNRIATLAVPAASSIPSVSATVPVAPGGLSLKDFTIDADNSTDGADVSYVRP